MTFQHVDILFQIVVFMFAISVHESAHAWTAWRLGDPTARMLGRVTLNPIKHIDPIGTVLLPIIALLTHFPVIGWAKPTPVNTRNFKHYVRDDVLTSVAGPVSNFIVATCATLALVVILVAVPGGRAAVYDAMSFKFTRDFVSESQSNILPVALLLYNAMFINVLAGNLQPDPGAAAGWQPCATTFPSRADTSCVRQRRDVWADIVDVLGRAVLRLLVVSGC